MQNRRTSTRILSGVALFLCVILMFTLSTVMYAQTVTRTPSPTPTYTLPTFDAALEATFASVQTQNAYIVATMTAMARGDDGDATLNPEADDDEMRPMSACGFTIDVPPRFIDANTDLETLIDAAQELDTRFDDAFFADALEAFGDMCFLLAFDVESMSSGYATNFNVIPLPLPSAYPVEFVVDATVEQYRAQGLTVESEIVQLNNADVGKIYTSTLMMDTKIRQVQYYMILDEVVYIVTFSALEEDFAAAEPTFEEILVTLRLDE